MIPAVSMPDPSLPPEVQIQMVASGMTQPDQISPRAANVSNSLQMSNSPSSENAFAGRKTFANFKFQRDLSLQSITTASTKFINAEQIGQKSLVMSPSFRYGM